MKRISRIVIVSLMSTLLAAAVTGCSQPTAEPTFTLELPASTTPSQTSTITLTASPTPTITITPTPTQTFTPTPIPPTPTPNGYFVDNVKGYSIILPSGWELDQNEEGLEYFIDKNALIFFFIYSFPSEEAMTSLEYAEAVTASSFPNRRSEFSEPFQVEVAGGITLEAVDSITSLDEGDFTMRFIAHTSSGQDYLLHILGASENIRMRENTLARSLKTLKFFPPNLFGTNRHETLNLTGYEPSEKELDSALTLSGINGYTGLLYAGLVSLSPDLQIVPDLAESWSISQDGMVYTFRLRDGLQFANGQPLTAENVRQSWERTADPDLESSVAKTYLGDILGYKEKMSGKADEIAGLEVIDDLTLQVTLDAPKPYFLAKLTYPTSFVIDTSQTKDDLWMWDPNASGPYILKEYLEQTAILFERNEKFHQPAGIRYLIYNLNPGGSTISLYESDRLDIAYLDSQTSLRVRDSQDVLHPEWQSTTSMCTSFILLNNTIPPFDDLKIRQAFSQAIDPQMLNENLSLSTSRVAGSILPPAMPGYTGSLYGYTFDPQAAREALAASSYAEDLPPVIVNSAGYAGAQRDDMAAIVELWKLNLGVEVQVKYLDPTDFVKAAHENHDHMLVMSWCADYPDPENFLDLLFHSESDMNLVGYSNQEVDRLLEGARTELDLNKRLQLYQEAEKTLLEDAAVIPLLHSVIDIVVKPRVQNYILSPIRLINIVDLWLGSQ